VVGIVNNIQLEDFNPDAGSKYTNYDGTGAVIGSNQMSLLYFCYKNDVRSNDSTA
jgi:hypothetical protein